LRIGREQGEHAALFYILGRALRRGAVKMLDSLITLILT